MIPLGSANWVPISTIISVRVRYFKGPLSHDDNGNLTLDTDKGISYNYNHLNLPYEALKANDRVEWFYTATGRKLRKTVTIAATSTNKDYYNEIENAPTGYTVHHSEGQVTGLLLGPSRTHLQWEYNLKDHLGNVRVVYADTDNDGTLDILQNNQYYAFGSSMYGEWSGQGISNNDYKYNGKELQTELGLGLLDFGARFYDPVIGRFTGVDPIADQFPHVSTYNYAENEPVANIDLWGLQAVSAVERQIEKNNTDYLKGNKSKAEFLETNKAIGQGGIVGLSLLAPDPSDAIIGGFVAKVFGFFSKGKKVANEASDISSQLQKAANDASDAVGDGSGAVHGTKVHSEFSKKVDGIDGVTPEVSYKDGEVVPYGTKGSVRPDVVEGDINSPTNIYDLKTGNAKVGQKDIDKFKEHVPGSPTVNEIKPE